MDLGVSPVVMGSFFFELISSSVAMQCLVVGVVALSTQAERIAALWQCLRGWYRNHKPSSMLDNLTKEMIFRDGKCKLRAKAAECRYLVPFCVYVANKVRHLSTHWMTVASLFQRLYKLQMMVSGVAEWNADEAGQLCRQFCSLLEALNREADGKNTWPIKPKLHLMQEPGLCIIHIPSFNIVETTSRASPGRPYSGPPIFSWESVMQSRNLCPLPYALFYVLFL